MKQRILSIALILCMLLSLVPVSVFAATNYELYINNFQFSSTNLTYTSGSGSATYDPDTNTLTIKNLSLSTGGANTIIQSGISGLTMKIDGTLTLNLLASKVENGIDLGKAREPTTELPLPLTRPSAAPTTARIRTPSSSSPNPPVLMIRNTMMAPPAWVSDPCTVQN